ncbi:DoxX family protein [Mycobacterium sp.]|uniref:DoxX family protein n=1 Tax=Mycobacterium sp. TaxID=1785 RepID=UPI0025ED3C1C|nr:DoxX family protein [Mycobacterium sp.]MBW0012053.1 DoxX family protein [Mycobacterium sp.]
MSVLTSPKAYVALAALQAGDAVACAIPIAPITKSLDSLGVPDGVRPVLPVVKGLAAIGLLSVSRFPALARLTTAMLTVYFALAVGAHIRARDKVVNALPAASFLATFAAMTVMGPDQE